MIRAIYRESTLTSQELSLAYEDGYAKRTHPTLTKNRLLANSSCHAERNHCKRLRYTYPEALQR